MTDYEWILRNALELRPVERVRIIKALLLSVRDNPLSNDQILKKFIKEQGFTRRETG